jgi:hypothetical protein
MDWFQGTALRFLDEPINSFPGRFAWISTLPVVPERLDGNRKIKFRNSAIQAHNAFMRSAMGSRGRAGQFVDVWSLAASRPELMLKDGYHSGPSLRRVTVQMILNNLCQSIPEFSGPTPDDRTNWSPKSGRDKEINMTLFHPVLPLTAANRSDKNDKLWQHRRQDSLTGAKCGVPKLHSNVQCLVAGC